MMRILVRMVLMLSLAVMATSCDEPAAEQGGAARSDAEGKAPMSGGTVEFVSVGRGNQAWNPRAEDFGPQFVLFRSKAAWERMGGHYQFGETMTGWQERLARVDWTKQSVAALTLGEAGSTGFTIRLVRIARGERMEFVLASTKPEGAAGMMMTHPFELVILDLVTVPKDARFTLDGKDADFERHVFAE